MLWNFNSTIKIFAQYPEILNKGLHGIEKECLRIDKNGNLAMTPHPKGLGSSLQNPNITTDFCESQLELITPAFETIEKTLRYLEKLHYFTYKNIGDELLWPLSMPCRLPAEEDIPIARYGDSPEGKKRETYRKGLALRYGKTMQTICGIHYNTSFSLELWDILFNNFGQNSKKQNFINESYLHLVRNFIRFRWLLVYLFGVSPYCDKSYPLQTKEKTNNAISLRLRNRGYSNTVTLDIHYDNFEEHIKSLKKAVQTPYEPYAALGVEKNGEMQQLNDHLLQVGNEYYFPIRLKPKIPYNDLIDALDQNGVAYIEIRMFDLNPFEKLGIGREELLFCHMFLLFCLLNENSSVNNQTLNESSKNQNIVAINGRSQNVILQDENREIPLKNWGKELLMKMLPLAEVMNKSKIVVQYLKKLDQTENLPGFQLAKEMDNNTFMRYGIHKAKKIAQNFT